MSNQFSIRTAEPRDAGNYAEWLKTASAINLVDYDVYKAPTCNTFVVDKDADPALMNSIQLVIVMEALAPKPGLEPKDEARALKELFEGIKRIAEATGVKEIMFGCKDESLHKFIEKRGFEKLSFPVFRYKV